MKKPPQIMLTKSGKVESKPASFLRIHHCLFRATYPDGKISKEFNCDIVKRDKMDAVIIIAHFIRDGKTFVYLRSCLRPALYDRFGPELGNGWELPAGLIERKEDPVDCAVRETKEELGFDLDKKDFKQLGGICNSAVGLCGEQLYFYEVEVDPNKRGEPTLDGSPMEYGGEVIAVQLEKALELSDSVIDTKTEIGLRRLQSI
jgi:8-oxo-dGTP pyrophosphatase MutT (NUDIX family)